MIVRLPHVVRGGAISSEPELALDASHVEALGKVVVWRERLGGDGDRAARRSVLARGLSSVGFGLIEVAQSEVWAELEGVLTGLQSFDSSEPYIQSARTPALSTSTTMSKEKPGWACAPAETFFRCECRLGWNHRSAQSGSS